MLELILRADDLGYSEAVNYGIAKTVKEGMIKNVGLMPNMEYANHGYQLIKDENVCLGQHTNLCVGYPCSHPKKIPSLVDENGMFISSKKYRESFMQGKDIIDVNDAIIEIEAQYLMFKKITGKDPDYFEAHALPSENLREALRFVANKYHLHLNDMMPGDKIGCYDGHPICQLNVNSMDSLYDPIENLKDEIIHNAHKKMPNVYVCHPGYIDAFLLRTSSLTTNRVKEVEMLCNNDMKEWLKGKIKFITYLDIERKEEHKNESI